MMYDPDNVEKRRALNAEWNRALRENGTQSIEYRRATRRMYRSYQRRIDYLPDRKAMEVLAIALQRRYAYSFTDAINQALQEWAESFPELNTGE
jgi:hypothetical protein